MRNFKKITSTILTSVLTFNVGVSCLNFNVVADEMEDENQETTQGVERKTEAISPYTIFAGSSDNKGGKVAINCIKSIINGNIYTDADFETSTSELKVNGRVDTTGKINNHGPNFSVETENENVAKQQMPDWDFNIMQKAGYAEVNDDELTQISEENLKDFTLKTSGEVVIEKTDFDGVCYIISEGDIKLDANKSKMPDGIVLYSKQGNIEVNGKDVDFKGIVYAPNGSVSFNNETANINGRIFGSNVNLNGNEFNVTSSEDDFELINLSLICTNATYNAEQNAIDIEWYSIPESDTYKILSSDDGEVYGEIATVTDTNEYQYKITEEFDTKYFKISFENSYGKLIESLPFSVTKTENGYEVSMTDTDEDGLSDEYEILLGTNKNEKDTDKDGLTDFDEVYKTGTNPLKFDSVEDGKSDSDVDIDEDGLTNLEEINNDTNPRKADTDNDGLSDKEEIEKYKTNPLIADTDNDKLNDGDDISLGFDPLNPDTDGNGVLDGDEKIEQTFTKDTSDKDEVVSGIEVTLNATGNVNKTTKVEDIKDKDILCSDVVGLVGNPYEITTESQFDNATITFKVDKEKLGDTKFEDLMFLWYDEKNDDFVELETIQDEENGTLSVETTHFSSYMLVDSKQWFDNWRKIATAYEPYIKSQINIPLYTAICVDCSGSMGSNDPNNLRNPAVENYIAAMLPNDSADVITYESDAKLIWSRLSSEITGKKEEYKEFDGKFYAGRGTNAEAAVRLAIEQIKKNTCTDETVDNKEDDETNFTNEAVTKTDIKKTILLLADDDVNVSEATLNEAKELEIIINTVSLRVKNNTRLEKCSEVTGGEYFEVADADSLIDLFNERYRGMKLSEFRNLPDSDKDGLANEIEEIGMPLSNGRCVATDPQKADTDSDGLKDGQEVSVLPKTKMMAFMERISNQNGTQTFAPKSIQEKKQELWEITGIANTEYSFDTIVYVSFKSVSDPTLNDTDYDGIDDKEDIKKTDNRFKADWYHREKIVEKKDKKDPYKILNHRKKDQDAEWGEWSKFNKDGHQIEYSVDYRKLFDANTTYDSSLAMFSSLLAADVYGSNKITVTSGATGGNDTSKNLQSVMGMEMETIDSYDIDGEDYNDDDKDDNTQVVIGHRTIDYKGKSQNVVLISVRGTNSTNAEWSSNFDVGADTDDYYDKVGSNHPYWKNKKNHKGFDVAKNRALEKIKTYLKRHFIDSGYVLITGHSRGAAIANLLGKEFEDNKNFVSATYTFAAPNNTTESNTGSYKSIFNIVNNDDIIPMLPLKKWGFGKYGKLIEKSVKEDYESTSSTGACDWTWEWLVEKKDYNDIGEGLFEKYLLYQGVDPSLLYEIINDYDNDGGTERTIKELGKIADSREELYVFDQSWQGNAIELYFGKNEDEILEIFKKEKIDKFCDIVVINVDFFGLIKDAEIEYCPAYLMQVLANLATEVGDKFRFTPLAIGHSVTWKYAFAELSFVLSSGPIPIEGAHLGGMRDPHEPITYYLLAHNIK